MAKSVFKSTGWLPQIKLLQLTKGAGHALLQDMQMDSWNLCDLSRPTKSPPSLDVMAGRLGCYEGVQSFV